MLLTSSCSFCPMECPYVTPTKESGASCLARSTSSGASGMKLSSRVPAGQLASCKGPERTTPKLSPARLV
jgi:hypothetical protein